MLINVYKKFHSSSSNIFELVSVINCLVPSPSNNLDTLSIGNNA